MEMVKCEASDVEVHFRAEIVNVYDPFEVEWAMVTRMKVRSDIVITQAEAPIFSKVFIDVTAPFKKYTMA